MAVFKYNVMPDAATQAMIKAQGGTIQIVQPAAPAGAPAANSPGGSPYLPNPYLSGPQTVTDISGTQPLNNSFFANQDTANRIAQAQGGTVTAQQGWGGPGISSATTNYGVTAGGQQTNPALTAEWVNKYGPEYAARLAGTPGLANLGRPAAPAPTVSPAPTSGAGAQTQSVPRMNAGDGMAAPVSIPRTIGGTGAPLPYQMPPSGQSVYAPLPRSSGDGRTTGVGPNPVGGGASSGPIGFPQNPIGAAPGTLPTFQPAGTTDYTSGYQQWPNPGMPLNDVVKDSTDITKRILSDRDLALGQGQALTGRYGSFADQSANRSAALQGQLDSAYAPIAQGQGGYTAPEKNAILREQELYGLKTTPSQLQSNFLTGAEQSSILGDPNAGTQAFQTGAGAMRNVYGNEAANVGGTLNAGAAAVRGTIDPSKLGVSSDFMQNYQWTPQMTQAMTDAAARGEMAKTQATQQDIANRAFAQGNVSPAALAAMQDRARQTGDVASADAMTDARLRAQEAALGVTQGREQTRLGAEQGLAGLASANEQQLAQRATGAGLELGGQQLGAEQYLTGAGIGAAQTGEQEAAQRNAYLGQNRQSINTYNQGQQYQQGMDVNKTASDRNTQFGNARMQQEAEYRNNYLGGQQQQANQNVTVGNQQQLGTFGTQMGAANEADKNATYNKSLPGLVQKVFGFAHGGTIKGPTMALVGEHGPEAIVPLRRPGMVARMPHAASPRYGLPTSALPRTTTGVGFNRLLPKFDEGGVVDSTSTPWWKTALALGLTAGLGRSPLLGGVAGDLAGRVTGQNKSDPRNIAAELAKSTIGRNNPALGKGVGDVIAPPPAAPGREKDTGFYQGTVIPNVFAPNPYPRSADNLTIVGGNQSAQPKPTVPKPQPKPIPRKFNPPPRQPAPPPNLGPPPDVPYNPPPIPPGIGQDPKIPPPPNTSVDETISYPPGAGGSGIPTPLPPGQFGDPWPVEGGGMGPQPADPIGIGHAQDPVWGPEVPEPGGDTDPYTGIPIGAGVGDPNPIYQPDPSSGFGGWQPGPVTGGGSYEGGDGGGYPGGDIGGGGYDGGGEGGGWDAPEYPDPMMGDALGELVTQPSIRLLGEAGPEAVVPLTPRRGNKVTPDMLPALIRKYSKRHSHGTN